MLVILGVDQWGIDWSEWAEIRTLRTGRRLRFIVAKNIIWC